MILFLILPVWLMAMLLVVGLCAGARLGDSQLRLQAADAQLTLRRLEDHEDEPVEEPAGSATSGERRRIRVVV